jgi:hypothetical protein
MSKYILSALGVLVALSLAAFGWWTLSPLFIDRVVDEEFEYEEEVVATTESPVQHEESVPEQTAPLQRTGTFHGADSAHRGTGTARILETTEGAVLRLEDFEVTNGPDLYVVLAESESPREHDEFGEYVELARLKGNIGNQTYTLPAGIDPEAYRSVVIYCKAFSVVFATAALN